jgi:hypothetical protein
VLRCRELAVWAKTGPLHLQKDIWESGQVPEAHNELAFVLRQRLRDFAGLLHEKLPDRPEGAVL